MVSQTPKTPKRDFKIKYKGKSVQLLAHTESGGSWGGGMYCPWFCGRHFEATLKSTPKRVAEKLQLDLEAHWKARHNPKK